MQRNRINKVFFLLIIISLNSFSVIAVGNLGFWDEYDTSYSTNYDAITWINTDMLVYLENYEAGTKVVCWDWNGDGVYSHCFAESSSDLNSCRAESSTLDSYCSSGKCHLTGDLGAKHWMEVDLPVGKYMNTKYYMDCGLPGYDIKYPTDIKYYILQRRRFICNSKSGTYWDGGDFNDPYYWAVIQDDISCSANYGCDFDKDWTNADFGGSGTSVPSVPCSKINGQSCSSDSDCVNYCSPSGICVSYTCGDGDCDTGAGEWCESDYCGSCGGGTCNTCNSNQCPSYYWYNFDNGDGSHQYCYNNDNLCCLGDLTFGQYFCMNNEDWAVCKANDHHACESQGNYYCIYENGKWKWVECLLGCNTGTQTCNTQPKNPDISVSPTTLNFEIGYGD